jgi:hypothetical protein
MKQIKLLYFIRSMLLGCLITGTTISTVWATDHYVYHPKASFENSSKHTNAKMDIWDVMDILKCSVGVYNDGDDELYCGARYDDGYERPKTMLMPGDAMIISLYYNGYCHSYLSYLYLLDSNGYKIYSAYNIPPNNSSWLHFPIKK